MNPDQLVPSALRVNLESKLEGRRPRGRTHLASPAVAAPSAVMGRSLQQKNWS